MAGTNSYPAQRQREAIGLPLSRRDRFVTEMKRLMTSCLRRQRCGPFANLCAALLAVASGCRADPHAPPSVVLIVVDTLRADHLGVYGYDRPTSPSLDRWASDAVVFERAHAPSPWTLPSFGSLLTGHTPTRHRAGRTVAGDALDTAGRVIGEERSFSAPGPRARAKRRPAVRVRPRRSPLGSGATWSVAGAFPHRGRRRALALVRIETRAATRRACAGGLTADHGEELFDHGGFTHRGRP